jgi:hypothetical protein
MFAVETRQHEIRQAQFGVRPATGHALPIDLALSRPHGADRGRSAGADEAFADVGDAQIRNG